MIRPAGRWAPVRTERRREGQRRLRRRAYLRAVGISSGAGVGAAAAATAGFNETPNFLQLVGLGLSSAVAGLLAWSTAMSSAPPTKYRYGDPSYRFATT